MFVLFVEIIIIIILMWVLIYQVILPTMNVRPRFPMFSRTPKLEKELAEVKQAQDEKALERVIRKERKKKVK